MEIQLNSGGNVEVAVLLHSRGSDDLEFLKGLDLLRRFDN